MELTHDDVQRILQLIDEAKHLEEFDLAYGDFQLRVRRHASGEPQAQLPLTPPSRAAAPAPDTKLAAAVAPSVQEKTASQPVKAGMRALRAPMLGTFYRAPSPGERPFVEVGQTVKAEDTVCLVEVMKLFNAIKAGIDGRIAEIRAENGKLVEYNEVLIVIEPAKK